MELILPSPLRAALFDLDGTLVRTFINFPAMRHAMQALSARHGTAEATRDEEDILDIVARMTTALGGTAGEAAHTEAMGILSDMEREGCAHPEPVAGASALLRQLRNAKNIPVGIITRNCREVAEDLLSRMTLEHDVLIAREDVPEWKPHPAPVFAACRYLKVSPADTIMVGDLWADIAAGRTAGVGATIGIQWAHDPPDRFARCRPDAEIHSLEEVADALLLLPSRV